MKSSRDIPPRVGMQVRWCEPGWGDKSFKVSRGVESLGFYDSEGNYETGGYAWEDGVYEITWTPPTEDERRLFMEAARHCRTVGAYGYCGGYCDWCNDHYYVDPCPQSAIAESLALDGADYDGADGSWERDRRRR